MATQERDPRPYELMTVFVPELSEEDTQAQVDKVSTYIANAGGSPTEALTSSPWGRRRLAYTIRFNGVDYRDGFYTVFHFDSAPSTLTELERELKLDTSVMRYLLVHDDPKAGEQFTEGEGDEAAEGEESATAETSASGEATTTAAAEPAQSSGAASESATESDTPDQAPAERAAPAEAADGAAETESAPAEPAAVATETESGEAETSGEATESDDTPDKE